MKLKTAAFGLATAAALSLSLSMGALAAPGDTQVTLAEGSPCTLGTLSGANMNFGSATWNGTAYVGTLVTGTLTVPVTNSIHGVTSCDVVITVSNMTGAVGAETIAASNISVTGTGFTGGIFTIPQNTSADLTSALSLAGLTVSPDVYNGTITVGAASASA